MSTKIASACVIIALSCLVFLSGAHGQSAPTPSTSAPIIQFIHMGGSDCPPCEAWRAIQLPKLEKSPSFNQIKFYMVTKVILSQIPPRFFLPSELKPLKEKLDLANNGGIGSPLQIIVVDGEVFDIVWGTKDASELDKIFRTILRGEKYPAFRCVKRSAARFSGGCETTISPS